MIHGGDTYGLDGIVDFSANLNPLGTPPQVLDALRASLHSYDVYPDPLCRDLVTAISVHESVPAEWVVPGAGASDLFLRIALARKPKRAAIPCPEFSGYEHALRQVGCEIVDAGNWLDGTFAVRMQADDVSAFDLRDMDIVSFSNPNNPTGLAVGCEQVESLVGHAARDGFHVVADESFAAFADMKSAVELCGQYPQLIVVKSLTKLYSIAGLRLGYAVCSDTAFIEALRVHGAEWSVPTPAQIAGVAALGVDEWEERTRAYVAQQRAKLVAGLAALGIDIVEGKANYVLFRCDRSLRKPLLGRGFAVRTCESFAGLGPNWYRIAVRTEKENAAFLTALQEVLS